MRAALVIRAAMSAFILVLFVIAGMAVRGQHWAWGITIGILSLAFMLLVHAAWFGAVWMLAQMQSRKQEKPAHPSD